MALSHFIKSTIISLTKEITKELEQYENLPLFLAALYLTSDLSHELYFFDYKIKAQQLGWDKDQHGSLGIFSIDGEFMKDIASIDDILNGSLNSIGGLYRSNPHFYKRLTAVYGNLSKQNLRLTHDTKFIKTPDSSAKHRFIYARNKNLRNSIRKLCQSYQALNGYIPHSLILPFLALHKNSALMEIIPKDQLPQGATVVKYDTQFNTLKTSLLDHQKSTIIRPEDLAAIYCNDFMGAGELRMLYSSFDSEFDYDGDAIDTIAKYKIYVSEKDLDKSQKKD